MRLITKVIIHCAATKPSMDIGASEIKKWHLDRGWKDIGYHYVIRRNGDIENGIAVALAGSHTKGHNANSIGICLVGGINDKGEPESNFTKAQWATLERLVRVLKVDFPHATVHGHREFAAKACPSFDVQEWLKNKGI
ncbi:MAG: N-acetylmuramoyl-L-alanine amidase [Pseudomonadota bacterium]|jgi:N-acetylmuramoyl-L-alanine amidase